MRSTSYGEYKELSALDRIGGLLSKRSINKIVKEVKFHNNLLDAGCGYEAKITKRIHEKFQKVYLADLSVSDKFKFGENTKYICLEGDLTQTLKKIPEKQIDLLVANNIIEHLKDPRETLVQFERILSREGVLYINVPSWIGKIYLEMAAFRLRLAPVEEMEDHKFYFNKHELWLLVRSAGFQPSTIKIKRKKLGLNTSALIKMKEN